MKTFVLFVMIILFSVVITGCSSSKNEYTNLDSFAKCLTEKGLIMYGSVNCSHCLAQKKMFSTSFQYINYVECTNEYERCATLQGVPTWETKDGTRMKGVQSLEQLAKASNCVLPK